MKRIAPRPDFFDKLTRFHTMYGRMYDLSPAAVAIGLSRVYDVSACCGFLPRIKWTISHHGKSNYRVGFYSSIIMNNVPLNYVMAKIHDSQTGKFLSDIILLGLTRDMTVKINGESVSFYAFEAFGYSIEYVDSPKSVIVRTIGDACDLVDNDSEHNAWLDEYSLIPNATYLVTTTIGYNEEGKFGVWKTAEALSGSLSGLVEEGKFEFHDMSYEPDRIHYNIFNANTGLWRQEHINIELIGFDENSPSGQYPYPDWLTDVICTNYVGDVWGWTDEMMMMGFGDPPIYPYLKGSTEEDPYPHCPGAPWWPGRHNGIGTWQPDVYFYDDSLFYVKEAMYGSVTSYKERISRDRKYRITTDAMDFDEEWIDEIISWREDDFESSPEYHREYCHSRMVGKSLRNWFFPLDVYCIMDVDLVGAWDDGVRTSSGTSELTFSPQFDPGAEYSYLGYVGVPLKIQHAVGAETAMMMVKEDGPAVIKMQLPSSDKIPPELNVENVGGTEDLVLTRARKQRTVPWVDVTSELQSLVHAELGVPMDLNGFIAIALYTEED